MNRKEEEEEEERPSTPPVYDEVDPDLDNEVVIEDGSLEEEKSPKRVKNSVFDLSSDSSDSSDEKEEDMLEYQLKGSEAVTLLNFHLINGYLEDALKKLKEGKRVTMTIYDTFLDHIIPRVPGTHETAIIDSLRERIDGKEGFKETIYGQLSQFVPAKIKNIMEVWKKIINLELNDERDTCDFEVFYHEHISASGGKTIAEWIKNPFEPEHENHLFYEFQKFDSEVPRRLGITNPDDAYAVRNLVVPLIEKLLEKNRHDRVVSFMNRETILQDFVREALYRFFPYFIFGKKTDVYSGKAGDFLNAFEDYLSEKKYEEISLLIWKTLASVLIARREKKKRQNYTKREHEY